MIVLNSNLEEVINIDMWPRPMSPEKHWQPGRSAMEFALYLLGGNGKIPEEIKNILQKNGLYTADDFKVYPEFGTSLNKNGFYKGNGRQHDALMVSELNSLVVGIEAKVDERFDNVVSKWLTLIKSKSGSNANKIDRADAFARAIFGEDKSHQDILELHYQLLSATIGTLLEAKKHSSKNAMLLILVIKKDGCYKEKEVEKNEKAYQLYLDMLENKKCENYYKLHNFPDIKFYIEYNEIEI